MVNITNFNLIKQMLNYFRHSSPKIVKNEKYIFLNLKCLMMIPEYKMVWENSENVDYYYPVNQNYTQIEKQ